MTARPHDRGYKSFPQEYFAVLDRVEHITESNIFRLGPFTRKDAQMARRSFYAFRNALNEEAEKDGEERDELARSYAPIANQLKLEVTDGDTDVYIRFCLNPLVAAMRRFDLVEEKQ